MDETCTSADPVGSTRWSSRMRRSSASHVSTSTKKLSHFDSRRRCHEAPKPEDVMRRAPILMLATVAGLVGVLSFHTKPSSISLGSLPGASSSSRSTTTTTPPTQPTSSNPATAGAPPSTTTSAVPSTTRTATGAQVNYNFGVLSVTVTASGKKITNIGIASLDDGGNGRSQAIDQQSIPMLEQQAMQAQSANIQGVSGASYTSAGFAQSLQSALSKLGL